MGIHWKPVAKRLPGAYWMAGALKYLRFSAQLRKADAAYHKRGDNRLPPPMLRFRVHGAMDEASYERNGKFLSDLLASYVDRLFPAKGKLKILDFASGPGRVLTGLKEHLPDSELHGSDIDAEAIGWASDHLGHVAEFATNEFLPPTRYPTDAFDVVYSISLFTHLDEELQKTWLRELVRIVKPGGVLIATTHGSFCKHVCTPAELALLEDNGIAFRVDRKGRFKLDGLPDFYQTTFHTKEYVLREWSKFARVESYVEGGVKPYQDLVILRKPTAA